MTLTEKGSIERLEAVEELGGGEEPGEVIKHRFQPCLPA